MRKTNIALITITIVTLFILSGCSTFDKKINTVNTNTSSNVVTTNFDSCISNTKDNPQCKDCCDCLAGADTKMRTSCRDTCATHDFSKNSNFITVDAPSIKGASGDYSECVNKGASECKFCCENSIGLTCGDYRFCRTACNDAFGDVKHNITAKTNQNTSKSQQTTANKTGTKQNTVVADIENSSLDSSSTYISGKTVSQLLETQAGSTLLGRIESNSVTLNVLATPSMEAYIEYGTSAGAYTKSTTPITSASGEPVEIVINDLSPDTEYYYKTNYKKASGVYQKSLEYSFHTQRPTGNSFTFDVQADPHMDGHSEPAVYKLTLQNEAGDNADFIVDLGDTFMTEKFAKTQDEVNQRYVEQRSYLDIVGSSTPLFLANGNHEGEFGWMFSSSNKNNDAYWALNARKTYYPNPYPDTFYTGSSDGHENYYSWEWGDAQFIVLDPYTYSTEFRKQTGDMWDSTIGDEQYQWFKNTLETSHAKYKFVFIHHMLGEYRGMTSWADKYEWGGYSQNGVYDFKTKRPTWEMPIHQLMVKNNVTIFFQGHDHLFSKEELDGIVYQEIAQPSTSHGDPAPGTEGAYSGEVLTSPGYMRISVTPTSVKAEYLKTYLSGAGTNKDIAYSYVIPGR